MSKQPSLFGGASIIAGVCVGAGMLALPTAGAGAWTIWTIFDLLVTMITMTLSGWLLLDVYKSYPLRVSFNTVTKDLLGSVVNVINNLAVYFVGGILLYAYTTVSGGIFSGLTQNYVDFGANSAAIWSVIIVGLFSFIVWHSTRFVDRVSVLLIVFMAITFILSIWGLVTNINLSTLFDTQKMAESDYAKYTLAVLPVALTSFGYHHSVSSMRDYYGEERKAKWAIAGGTTIALLLYLLWIISIFGVLPRSQFGPLIANDNVATLLNAVSAVVETPYISQAINAFTIAAILSSFVGVGLGTFDFLSDFFKFDNSKVGRTKAWAVTFLPPLAFSLVSPEGFGLAIGYAGAVATIWTCIIPAALAFKAKKSNIAAISLILIFGICTAVFHFLAMQGKIPLFKG